MKKLAVVTGASSGIGREFCLELSQKGYYILMVARRKKELENILKKIGCNGEVYVSDISDTNNIESLINHIEKMRDDGYKLSVFINNAGFGLSGCFLETDLQRECEMIDLNITALHILTKKVLHIMDEEKEGYLLNVASSAGLLPAGPYMATYYASKAYVASLTRAIDTELKEKKKNIHIYALCPGPVDTQFNDVAEVKFALKGISARECVSYALFCMKNKKNKCVIIPTFRMKFALFFSHIVPRNILIPLTGRQQKKKMG